MPGGIERIHIPKNNNDIIVTYIDANGGFHLAKMSDSAAIISGRTYADWNNDSVYSSSADTVLSNILITTNSTLTNSISGNDSGKYFMYVVPGSYTLNANFFNHPYYQFFPVTQSANISQILDTIEEKISG